MSELTSTQNTARGFRRHLLTTVSVLGLIANVYGTQDAKADDDTDRSTIWIELGGQLERIDEGQELYTPPFVHSVPPPLVSPVGAENALSSGFGGEGKVSFEPDGNDWVFSAAIRYGRAQSKKHIHQETNHGPVPILLGTKVSQYVTITAVKFADADVSNSETHVITDFTVGKDVGLGMFGRKSASLFSFGLRFTQFNRRSGGTLGLDPEPISYKYFGSNGKLPIEDTHTFLGSFRGSRSFLGVGPSVAWDASIPFHSSPGGQEFTFDWGVNDALLFGRQKASIHHATTEDNFNVKYDHFTGLGHLVYQTASDHSRAHSVTVPNLGAFAGLSFRFDRAKVSVGYRGDFFFGAMDGGLDTHKSYNQEFYGPFATVSVGLP